MRRLIVVLIVLAVVLVGADRIAAYAAGRVVAGHVENAAHLSQRPSVNFAGFPFLTQVATGHYRQVNVTAHGVTAGGLRFDTVQADLSGVHLPLSRVTGGNLSGIPVDRGTGSVLLSWADLDSYGAGLTPQLTFGRAGDNVRVTGTVRALGRSASVSGDASVAVSGQRLTITPVPASIRVAGESVPSSLVSEARRALTVTVEASGLPFGVELQSASVTDNGIQFGASSQGFVLPNSGRSAWDGARGGAARPAE